VTFGNDVLQHLGIRLGEKIELDLLPDGRCLLKATRPAGTINDFIGILDDRIKKVVVSIEEVNVATMQARASGNA